VLTRHPPEYPSKLHVTDSKLNQLVVKPSGAAQKAGQSFSRKLTPNVGGRRRKHPMTAAGRFKPVRIGLRTAAYSKPDDSPRWQGERPTFRFVPTGDAESRGTTSIVMDNEELILPAKQQSNGDLR
jgi:hypothetical protein